MSVYQLPAVNALLNGTAAVLLLMGWFAIKRNDSRQHMRYMIAALVASAAFLACYLLYHSLVQGVTRYQSEGLDRAFYLLVLLTHTPLATLMVPFLLAAVWFAYKRRFDWHTRITRWVWPVWMYVSVTGVIIYVMLYVFPGKGVRGL